MLARVCQLGGAAEHATPIERVGEHAARMLRADPEGTVANVFPHSLYLAGAGGGLLCVLAERGGMGPTCLSHGEARSLDWTRSGLRVGERWSRDGDRLAVGRAAAFSLERARPWRPPPAPGGWSPATLAVNLRALAGSLPGFAHGPLLGLALGARPPRSGLAAAMARRALPALSALEAWLVRHLTEGAPRHEAVPRELRALIGLGPGLTPSGDDCLAGAIVALRALGPPELADTLAGWIADAARGRTSPVSESHLLAACEGQAAEALHLALNALLAPSPRDLQARARALCALGESSGCDALAGVLIATFARCEAARRSAARLRPPSSRGSSSRGSRSPPA